MVIQDYNVQASSQRTSLSISSTNMLAVRNIGGGQNTPQISAQSFTPDRIAAYLNPKDTVSISPGAKAQGKGKGLPLSGLSSMNWKVKNGSLDSLRAKKNGKAKKLMPPGQAKKGSIATNPQEVKDKLMELLFELLMKRSGSISGQMSSNQMSASGADGSFSFSSQSINIEFDMSFFGSFFGSIGNDVRGPATAGWNVESFKYESETVSYQAQGIVNTADGKSINVDINMYMSRQFVEYSNIGIEIERALCDPLVINYTGTAASLTGERFSFDLTSDGNMESLAMLSEGSGFLAIDKNGDGKINDGNELFGPNSGCGFTELREYDKDGNGWIDEADEVFNQLLVWHKDKDGKETSYTLKELGIGAIYLGDIATEFSFKDDNNNTLGVMRSTSFFLKEDGSGAGFISHIDLAV